MSAAYPTPRWYGDRQQVALTDGGGAIADKGREGDGGGEGDGGVDAEGDRRAEGATLPGAPTVAPGQSDPTDNPKDIPAIPSGRSIAHHLYSDGKACLLSFDIETAGEYAGVCQISAELSRVKLQQKKGSSSKDEAVLVERED